MSEKRINSIIKDLDKNGIEVSGRVTTGLMAVLLVVDQGKGNIVSDGNTISFIRVIEEQSCIERIDETFQTLINVLLIDDNNQFVFNLEGTFDTEDSHKESVDRFNRYFNQNIGAPVYGVGYRLLLEDHEINGELKI